MNAAEMFYVSGTIGIWVGLFLMGLTAYHFIKLAQGVRQRIDRVEDMLLAAKTSVFSSILTVLTGVLGNRRGGERRER